MPPSARSSWPNSTLSTPVASGSQPANGPSYEDGAPIMPGLNRYLPTIPLMMGMAWVRACRSWEVSVASRWLSQSSRVLVCVV